MCACVFEVGWVRGGEEGIGDGKLGACVFVVLAKKLNVKCLFFLCVCMK